MLDRYFTLEDPTRIEPSHREMSVDGRAGVRAHAARLHRPARHRADRRAADRRLQDRHGAARGVRGQGAVPDEVLRGRALAHPRHDPAPAAAHLPGQRRDHAVRAGRGRPAGDRAQDQRALAGHRPGQRSGDWRPRQSRLCDWCSYQALCPVFGGTPPPLPEPETVAALSRGPGPEATAIPLPGPGPETAAIPSPGPGPETGLPGKLAPAGVPAQGGPPAAAPAQPVTPAREETRRPARPAPGTRAGRRPRRRGRRARADRLFMIGVPGTQIARPPQLPDNRSPERGCAGGVPCPLWPHRHRGHRYLPPKAAGGPAAGPNCCDNDNYRTHSVRPTRNRASEGNSSHSYPASP